MSFSTALSTHALPLWFLILSLFLPRICLVVAYLQNNLVFARDSAIGSGAGFDILQVHVQLIPLLLTIFIPRILILLLIYQDQGFSIWFLIHVVALLLAWGGGGSSLARRRGRRSADI